MDGVVSEIFSTTLRLFALMTPPAVLSAFLSGTKNYTAKQKRKTALSTGSAVFIIALVLYFFGDSILGRSGLRLRPFASDRVHSFF